MGNRFAGMTFNVRDGLTGEIIERGVTTPSPMLGPMRRQPANRLTPPDFPATFSSGPTTARSRRSSPS